MNEWISGPVNGQRSEVTFDHQWEFVGDDRLYEVVQVARVDSSIRFGYLVEVQLVTLRQKQKRRSAYSADI